VKPEVKPDVKPDVKTDVKEPPLSENKDTMDDEDFLDEPEV